MTGVVARFQTLPLRWKAALSILAFYTLLCAADIAAILGKPKADRGKKCGVDDEGTWSIGVFKGASPFELTPIEEWEDASQLTSGWPVANPVVTCGEVDGHASTFVADPFLSMSKNGSWYIFYESKNGKRGVGEIGASVSDDQGGSWRSLGVVLREDWHLSYPYVFEHERHIYMLPEASKSGVTRLYRAVNFPTTWMEHSVILARPMVDAVLFPKDGRWWLFGTDAARRGVAKSGSLDAYWSASPFGPFRAHARNPVLSGSRSAAHRNAGRPLLYHDRLYRFGQDCGRTYGAEIKAFEVLELSPIAYRERAVDLVLGGGLDNRGPWPKGAASWHWNGVRQHHIDVQLLPDGSYLAVSDGDSQEDRVVARAALARSRDLARAWAAGALVAALAFLAELRVSRGPGMHSNHRWVMGRKGFLDALAEGVRTTIGYTRDPPPPRPDDEPYETDPLFYPGAPGAAGGGAGAPATGAFDTAAQGSDAALEGGELWDGEERRGREAAGATRVAFQLDQGADPGSWGRAGSPARPPSAGGRAPRHGRRPGGGGTRHHHHHHKGGGAAGTAGGTGAAAAAGGDLVGLLRRAARAIRGSTCPATAHPARGGRHDGTARRPVLTYVLAALAGSGVLAAASLATASGYVAYASTPGRLPATTLPRVDGAAGKFTLAVMSYDRRAPLLARAVEHYSRCSSALDVLVVWNKGTPPQPEALGSAKPVRVRVEGANSLNNRFRPDPMLRTRAVLYVDDDVLLPCQDVERAFAAWRQHPQELVGFFPRILARDAPQYRGERAVFGAGAFNAVLTGAVFVDSRFFEIYSGPEYAEARKLVDELFNGEDILLNIVVARTISFNASDPDRHARYVRPTARVDLSMLASEGISHASNHAEERSECVRRLREELGLPLPALAALVWPQPGGLGPPNCWVPGVGCIYY